MDVSTGTGETASNALLANTENQSNVLDANIGKNNTTYSTDYTVTAGKTLYLTGIVITNQDTNTRSIYVSFDGGTTDHLLIGFVNASDSKSLMFPTPIVIAAGENIQSKINAAGTYGITYNGWEE